MKGLHLEEKEEMQLQNAGDCILHPSVRVETNGVVYRSHKKNLGELEYRYVGVGISASHSDDRASDGLSPLELNFTKDEARDFVWKVENLHDR